MGGPEERLSGGKTEKSPISLNISVQLPFLLASLCLLHLSSVLHLFLQCLLVDFMVPTLYVNVSEIKIKARVDLLPFSIRLIYSR
jgi:hypothetical protein